MTTRDTESSSSPAPSPLARLVEQWRTEASDLHARHRLDVMDPDLDFEEVASQLQECADELASVLAASLPKQVQREDQLDEIARSLFCDLCEGEGAHSEELDRALILKHLRRAASLPPPPQAEMPLRANVIGLLITCKRCHRQKAPVGRSAPTAGSYCEPGCVGYDLDPHVGSLWPGESEADFGYRVGNRGTTAAVPLPSAPRQEQTT